MKRILSAILLGYLLMATPWVGVVAAQSASGDDWSRVVDLRGTWLFNLGNDPAWASPTYDDRSWDRIYVPGAWEDEGYPGYDGRAWYRTSFELSKSDSRGYLYLHLGRIDDIDRVYLNGQFLGGSGDTDHGFNTAYDQFRVYRIPESYLRSSGPNVLAVQVYDHHLGGGIIEGRPGIYRRLDHPPMVADLAGRWDFQRGDDPAWRMPNVSRSGWEPMTVPGHWDHQGYASYDGVAWYRTRVFIPTSARGEPLVLLLGKIDDVDQTYWNGTLIGHTGALPNGNRQSVDGDEWQMKRAYDVDPDQIKYGAYNTIAVRVYDSYYHGGIFEGYIGLMLRSDYEDYAEPRPKSFWDRWFNQPE